MKNKLFLLAAFVIFSIASNAQSVQLQFKNQFNGAPLSFDQLYQTPIGDSVKFSTLNYFISNIELVDKKGNSYKVPQDSSYFLLKHQNDSSKTISLSNIPAGKYQQLVFTIGVDSVRNTLDVSRRTGTLDVGAAARGMYWVWNSGYIFFKLEGKTINQVDSLRKNFRYHIGGYGGYDSKTINNIKVRTIPLKSLVVKKGKNPVITIDVAVERFFNSIIPVKILEHPSVMWGDFSVKLANNYEQIFNLGGIKYE
jgi:hypothetical protein